MKKISILSLLAAALVAGSASAQQYPTRNVSMIVPFAAGGPTDTVARVLAQAMGKPMGQTVIVENRPSAGGILGPEQVKNSKPDGYTILIHHIGMATTPTLYRNLRFNPLTDFEPIGLINDVPMTIIGKPQLPDFPIPNALTRPLRQAAGAAGAPDFLSLWAGQALPLARRAPAAQIVRRLAAGWGDD